MTGCPSDFACADACCDGELSQHPMWPHWAQRRRCSHQPPLALPSAQPVPLGGTEGSMPGISVISVLLLRDARGGRRCDRQPHPEPGLAGDRLYRDIPVMLVHHDAPADVEAQPGPLADRLGGEERLEDPFPALPPCPPP